MHFLLGDGHYNALPGKNTVDLAVQFMQYQAPVGWLLDPAQHFEIQPEIAEPPQAHARLRLGAHRRVGRGGTEHERHDGVDFRTVRDPDRNPQSVLPLGTAGLIDDLGPADDAIRDADFHVVAGEQPGAAQADRRDGTPLAGIQHDVVTDPVGLVHQDGGACHQVAEGVLGRE